MPDCHFKKSALCSSSNDVEYLLELELENDPPLSIARLFSVESQPILEKLSVNTDM
jgi:hypothetical protein